MPSSAHRRHRRLNRFLKTSSRRIRYRNSQVCLWVWEAVQIVAEASGRTSPRAGDLLVDMISVRVLSVGHKTASPTTTKIGLRVSLPSFLILQITTLWRIAKKPSSFLASHRSGSRSGRLDPTVGCRIRYIFPRHFLTPTHSCRETAAASTMAFSFVERHRQMSTLLLALAPTLNALEQAP